MNVSSPVCESFGAQLVQRELEASHGGIARHRVHPDDELLAAPARDDVFAAKAAGENRRDLTQHAVAHEVAEAIVHILEMIEVDRGDRDRLALPVRQPESRSSTSMPRRRVATPVRLSTSAARRSMRVRSMPIAHARDELRAEHGLRDEVVAAHLEHSRHDAPVRLVQ